MGQGETNKTSLGLDQNVEGALCYLLGFVTGFVFLFVEKKENKFVRFHALQSVATFLPIFVAGFVLRGLAIILNLIGLILWVLLMLKAFQGEMFKLPGVGDFAEGYLKKESGAEIFPPASSSSSPVPPPSPPSIEPPQQQSAKTSEQAFCYNCGKPINANDAFCAECGKKL
jgi:uncharacterized membrane protein